MSLRLFFCGCFCCILTHESFTLPFQVWQSEEVSISGPKIPQALEKILQLKEIRQEQLTDPAGQYGSSCSTFHWDVCPPGRLSTGTQQQLVF